MIVAALVVRGDAPAPSRQCTPEDPLVLAWLVQVQDTSSPQHDVLASMAGENEAQTFNNALAAMAFVRHRDFERARRILDFYARAAADPDNADATLQSFYLKGEPRGFYQRMTISGDESTPARHAPPGTDRWMGDIAWLWLAMDDYQQTAGDARYAPTMTAIIDLLESYYRDDPRGTGGYVRHGWRNGDAKLHEADGHHEGNIDCSAVFARAGKERVSRQIRRWLARELDGREDLPLDCYAWRVLALGGKHADLLAIPRHDPRYRKHVSFNWREVEGFYSSAAAAVSEIWTEGLAHMACAAAAAGDQETAATWANELDKVIVEETISGTVVHGLPYALNGVGDYAWVDTERGFTSTAAWYILAKHAFNPLAPTRPPASKVRPTPSPR